MFLAVSYLLPTADSAADDLPPSICGMSLVLLDFPFQELIEVKDGAVGLDMSVDTNHALLVDEFELPLDQHFLLQFKELVLSYLGVTLILSSERTPMRDVQGRICSKQRSILLQQIV